MRYGLEDVRITFLLKIFLFFLLLLILPIFATYLFIKQAAISNIDSSLKLTVSQIGKDMKYKNGKWDINVYNSDPDTPSPLSSSSYPLYIMSADGFVIERNKPISGFLDSVDFKRLLLYNEPQTITTSTNEYWRVLSKPVNEEGKPIGVITLSYYNPNESFYEGLDRRLRETIEKIHSEIKVKNKKMNTESIDLKSIPYDISYLIANNFNKVILINNRVPAFIDPSYIAPEFTAGERIITDSTTNEKFLVLAKPLTDGKGLPVGIVATGRSINNLLSVLNNYVIYSFVSRFLIAFPLTILAVFLLKKELLTLLKNENRVSFKKISFNKIKSLIEIDKTQTQIPYSSNQYYLCDAVFSSPNKLWEGDELLEKFGEDSLSGKTRKIYDAMLAINKKTGLRLIVHKDKRYKFNPDFLPKLL